MFEQTNQTLLCSDLFHQNGDVTHLTDVDILEGHKKSMLELEKAPLWIMYLIITIREDY